MITNNNILAEKANLQHTINDINFSERLTQDFQVTDGNYVSAMFFRWARFFSQTMKKNGYS